MAMEEDVKEPMADLDLREINIRSVIHEAIQEFINAERSKVEPVLKTELSEERRRREQLERRVNELVQENERSRRKAEEAERHSAIRDELVRLGVTKVELGFKAVKDDIYRAPDGRLVAKTPEGEISMQEYLARFTRENPELLPARIAGGSGASATPGLGSAGRFSLDRIKPGMDPEELDRIRKEIAQALSHSYRGE
jgi:hypothetical protein